MIDRYERHYAFFGKEGQDKLQAMTAAIVGVGGTGSHVVQQLAHLGVGHLGFIEHEELDTSNRNRYVTADHDDPVPGSHKVDLAARLIQRIDPSIKVTRIYESLRAEAAFEFIKTADVVFGCVDNDGVRFMLNELCCAYERPYFDVATGIPTTKDYGGSVRSMTSANGCLVCWGELDQEEVDAYLASADQRAARAGAYGVPVEDLGTSGPSVISINGVVASLAVTEFLVWATGIREPVSRLVYRGNRGIVTIPSDKPETGCYYCETIRGQGDHAGVGRYLERHDAA